MHASQILNEAFIAATYLINRLPRKVINMKNPIVHLFEFLGVLAGPTCAHTMHTNFSFILSDVHSLVTVTYIKASSAFLPGVFTSLNYTQMSVLPYRLKF